MAQQEFYPFVVSYSYKNKGKETFILPGREVDLEGVEGVLRPLLSKCNGYKPKEEIIRAVSEETDMPEGDIEELFNVLVAQNIIVDAHNLWSYFHRLSSNPMPFFRNVSEEERRKMLRDGKSPFLDKESAPQSDLEELLSYRQSTREFSGKPIKRETLLRLGWATYGKISRSSGFPESLIGLGTIPSGGALYPLRLYGFVINGGPKLERALYRFGPDGLSVIKSFDFDRLKACLEVENLNFQDAQALLVLAADIKQTTQKYSNRGYRYALLEAGHAAQNTYLWCAQERIGVVELGGFEDKSLSEIIGLNYPNEVPLTVLDIGGMRDGSAS